MDEKTILIVGDRRYLIEEAIKRHVKMIILVKNTTLTSKELKLANENQINIIITPKSSFKIARVLCLSNPISSIKRGESAITFNSQDYLTDFDEITSKLKHTNYPIINNKNVCLGMLRTMDAHEVNKKKVILVDHNMRGQSVDGLEEAEILEIVDHHNLGDINTSTPVNFRCMKVGSVCTVIYYMYKENGIKIPPQIAGLMVSGIISDTLILKSPTTTEIDKLVATDLAKISKVDLKKYGLELLESGVSIDGMDESDIIYKDYKTYKVGDDNISISQVFTTDYNQYKNMIHSLIDKLNAISLNNNYKASLLFITNFLTNNSNVLFSDNAKNIVEMAYGLENIEQGVLLKNIVSRKKQMVPNIIDVLDHV
jgi:manganese-dependent inorganic pyrophosphatase